MTGTGPDRFVAISDEEHRHMEIAMRPGIMGALLPRSFPELSHGTDRALSCNILDAKYEPGVRCTILYQLEEQLVVGRMEWSTREPIAGNPRPVDSIPMNAYLFPEDPLVPGLAKALDDKQLTRALSDALFPSHGGEAQIIRCRATPLRYRPARRCTVRIEVALRWKRTGAITSRLLFAKLYHDVQKAAAVFSDALELSRSSLPADVVLAAPVALIPEWGMVLQEAVSGISLETLISPGPRGEVEWLRATSGVTGAASAIASLHHGRLSSGRARPGPGPAVERMARRARQVLAVDDGLGRRMLALASRLIESLDCVEIAPSEMTFVHGDCKPSQFLISGSKVAVLDFDHGGMADPASDPGNFIATIRQSAAHDRICSRKPHAPASRAQWHVLEHLFLDEYCVQASVGVQFRRRAVWYQAAALLRKAFRAFQRSPRSPLAGALVEEGFVCQASLDLPPERSATFTGAAMREVHPGELVDR